jgi:MFS family permease
MASNGFQCLETNSLEINSNASVIGNVSLLFAVIYPDALTNTMWSRLSNAFLIGMIIGMLILGFIVDHHGRKTGAVLTTTLLSLGIILSTGAAGKTPTGMMWMLVVARGVAGAGAGGEYPVTGKKKFPFHTVSGINHV